MTASTSDVLGGQARDRVEAEPLDIDAEEWVTEIGDSFRFVDVNPWRPGASYSASRYEELPRYAAQRVPVTAYVWDELVRCDATDHVVDVWRLHSLAGLGAWLSNREQTQMPGVVCPDCWGCGVSRDADGSITGTAGSLYPCGCGDALREEIAEHERIRARLTERQGRTSGASLGWPGAGVLA